MHLMPARGLLKFSFSPEDRASTKLWRRFRRATPLEGYAPHRISRQLTASVFAANVIAQDAYSTFADYAFRRVASDS